MTSTALPSTEPASTPRPAWRLDWLTPVWCRVILVGLILFAVVPRIFYLNSPDALNLAPDEAQYWVWSKQLDWSYYSKGPMVALFIRASTELFGDTMPAVRYPALFIGVCMTLMTYFLTKKLFGSERLAVGAVALNFLVPMFIAGSMLMTIDPPFVLFWSAATYFLCKAVIDGKWWCWPAMGLMVGLSFLAKYSSFFLFLGMFVGLLADRQWRRYLLTPGPYLAVLVAALCTFPVLYWNHLHGWASAHHVQADTTNGFNPMEPVEFLGGQFAVVGPFLCVLMWAAVWWSLRGGWKQVGSGGATDSLEHLRRARLLVLTVLPYMIIVVSSAFFTNAQLNWTAPLFFALLIATAWFISTRLASPAAWKPWRGFLWGTVIFALVLMPVAHNVRPLYPAFAWFLKNVQHKFVSLKSNEAERYAMTDEQKKNVAYVRRFDPTARLLGWEELAQDVYNRRNATVGEDAFLMADDYSEASELAFYVPGQPKTYVMGPYIEDPAHRGRSSQWDMWPDRSLERGKTQLVGKNAIYIGRRWQVLNDSFDRVEQLLPIHEIYINVNGVGYHIGGYRVWACYGFKGMVRPKAGTEAW